jgi:putative choline sulfate-utilization transcription factor
MSLLHRLPLPALIPFEAAARRLNFSAAAQELGTTQPSVSQHVAWLESELGTRLFRRLRRGVELTADGILLFEAVHDGLGLIDRAARDIRTRHERRSLTVATDFAFASFWLMPRLGRFRATEPGTDVRILTSQERIDPRSEDWDIAIIFSDMAAVRGLRGGRAEAELLWPERVVAVATPDFRTRHAGPDGRLDPARLPLLHLDSAETGRWLTWHDWFQAQGLAPSKAGGSTFSNYPLVIQAALLGQGIALGWLPLIRDMLHSGQLVPALEGSVETGRGYYLIMSDRLAPGRIGDLFRDWLLREAALS